MATTTSSLSLLPCWHRWLLMWYPVGRGLGNVLTSSVCSEATPLICTHPLTIPGWIRSGGSLLPWCVASLEMLVLLGTFSPAALEARCCLAESNPPWPESLWKTPKQTCCGRSFQTLCLFQELRLKQLVSTDLKLNENKPFLEKAEIWPCRKWGDGYSLAAKTIFFPLKARADFWIHNYLDA